jgi:hypothetical protein
MHKRAVSQKPTSTLILANTAGRILDRSPASVRLYVHSGRLKATVTEEGVHILDRRDVEAFRETLGRERSEQPAPARG